MARRGRAVPSLPTHYREPVTLQRGALLNPDTSLVCSAPDDYGVSKVTSRVRGAGRGTYLFDNSGQPLLDLCNNPAGFPPLQLPVCSN